MTVTRGLLALLEAKPGKGGEITKALATVGPDLLAGDPDIRTVEVPAVK
jgi:hypothetical protein